MLEFLRASGRAYDRKLRLFSCACVRRLWWEPLSEGFGRLAVAMSEAYADGLIDEHRMMNAWDPADPLYQTLGSQMDLDHPLSPEEALPVRSAIAACWVN